MANADRPDDTRSTTNERGTTTETQPSQPSTSTPQRYSRPQSDWLTRRNVSGGWDSPFSSLFQRLNEEMDRMFEDVGLGRNSMSRGQTTNPQWAPQIEMFQQGNDLIVR